MEVAFIGLGAMGFPMAGHLAQAFSTRVFNRTPTVAHAHAEVHKTTAVSLAEAVTADVVVICLPTTADVREVAGLAEPALSPGSVWVDATSGDPVQSRELAAWLAERGVDYLGAPVSGGTAGAEAGTLTVMVGGDAEVLERTRPVIDAYAARVVHVGDAGAGHAVKAVNNTLLAVNLWAAAEGLVALKQHGVEASLALEVINGSSGRSNVTENLFPERVLDRSFPRTFALSLLHKDVGIAGEVVRAVPGAAPLMSLTAELYAIARRELDPDADHVEVVRVIESWAGVEL